MVDIDARATPGGAAAPRPSPTDPAWILFTSGSSGRPKGVPGTHRGLANRLAWGERAQPFRSGDVALAKTRLGFVDSVVELLAPLAAGVPVVLADEPTAADPARLAQLLADAAVTRLILVPSLLRVLIELAPDTLRTSRLRLVSASGEALDAADVRSFQRLLPDCELWNIYGSTEVAADATAHRLTRHDSGRIPIGRPIDNVSVTLTDPHGRLVPLGAIGEITIAGAGLAPGYLGHADTENHRFTARGYRTGDLGRWRPDGTLEHHGRADRQIKLRGIRIEPDELEHTLKTHPHITDAAAHIHTGPDGPTLTAFYSASPETPAEEVRRHLQQELPAHLIPGRLTELTDLPHLPNGKLDRRALEHAAAPAPATAAEPPRTPEEVAVAEVFAELRAPPGSLVMTTSSRWAATPCWPFARSPGWRSDSPSRSNSGCCSSSARCLRSPPPSPRSTPPRTPGSRASNGSTASGSARADGAEPGGMVVARFGFHGLPVTGRWKGMSDDG